MKNWIPIFKTGTHTDSAGNTKTWTEQDLDHIVSSYSPANHEAPEVIGHPKDNAPAFGWVEALKRVGDILYYQPKQRIAEFEEMIKKGLFKKRSISLYPDGTLRHVGWLGAMPPAIKGLPDVAFSDNGSMTIDFEESADAQTSEKEVAKMNFWERLKEKLAGSNISFRELFGSDTPPVLYTEGDVRTKIETAVADAVKAKQSEFSEAQTKKDLALRQAQDELKTREEALRKKEADAKKTGINSFMEGLKEKGILTPAMDKLGMGITSFMEALSSIEDPVEFGEGDGKRSQTPLEFMQTFLSGLPKAIEFGEVAGGDKDKGAGQGNAAEKLTALTQKKLADKKDLTFSQAFAEVQNENPELADEYAAELAG